MILEDFTLDRQDIIVILCTYVQSCTGKGKMIKERKGSWVGLRLTDAEKTGLKSKANTAGLRPGEYIRQLIRGSDPVSEEKLDEVKWELKKIGVNVNQIAYRANSKGMSQTALDSMTAQLREIERISDALRAIKWR